MADLYGPMSDMQEALLLTVLPCIKMESADLPLSLQKLQQRRLEEAREALGAWLYHRLLEGASVTPSTRSFLRQQSQEADGPRNEESQEEMLTAQLSSEEEVSQLSLSRGTSLSEVQEAVGYLCGEVGSLA
eukprot:symbB.v1.2.008013.t2/scaffold498.1/size458234/5